RWSSTAAEPSASGMALETTGGLWFRGELYGVPTRPPNPGIPARAPLLRWLHGAVDTQLTTVGASLARSDERMLSGKNSAGRVWKTGFGGLDPVIGGGFRAGSL